MRQFCEHRNGAVIAQCCIALIGVGANLPTSTQHAHTQSSAARPPNLRSPLQTCKRAVAMLDALPGFRLIGLSRWYETAPIPPSGQPPYVNAVAALRYSQGPDASGPTPVDPAELLAHLLQIEDACGRQRSAPNAARTLDLDIIAIGDCVRDAPDPILPHPRAHLRAFVLAPLAEVAPTWIHPVLRQSAASLLAALPPQHIRPLDD